METIIGQSLNILGIRYMFPIRAIAPVVRRVILTFIIDLQFKKRTD